MEKKKHKRFSVKDFENAEFEYPVLEILLCGGKPLWNINDGTKKRKQSIKKILKRLRDEHARSLEDEQVGPIDAGVLLGALSLVAGLLDEATE